MSGSIKLSGDVKGLTNHLRKLKNLDFAGVNAILANTLKDSTKKDRFDQQRDPSGRKWKQSIRAHDEGGKTLTNKSRLRNSIRAKSDSGGFAVGTNVVYARRHQFGDSKPMTIRAKKKDGVLRFKVGGRWICKGSVRVQLPARPFLGISEEDMREIEAVLQEAIDDHG